ncbi:MAG: N-glycosyltransferase [Flavobacteriaceae bacterium]|nr:N-glycosyltransferase [Flavobacteriaceae bacterium]
MAVFIPAYKEDEVIVDVARHAIRQKYPPSFFDIIIIADSMKEETIQKLRKLPIKVIEVSFEKSTKAKALNTAMKQLERNYDYAIVLDADNLMEPEFLSKMNNAFNNGYKVVQGHRQAKNLNTTYAILDAASEEINNHIYRRGHRALDLSSGLIGSGMGFDYKLFKSIMEPIQAIGGFDKELEFELAGKQIEIEYLQDAVVLDEKIQKGTDFSNQRRRWLATQFIYLRRYCNRSWGELFRNKNMNFFDKVWQMIVPPRVLLLGFTIILTMVYLCKDFVFGAETYVSPYFWLLNFVMVITAFVLALPRKFYNKETFKAMMTIPSAFFRMFLLLFRMKGANKKFIHTKHGTVN